MCQHVQRADTLRPQQMHNDPAMALPRFPGTTPAFEVLEEKYRSDEFRLYCFKVLPCSQRKHHDWTKCPFAHVGERAKRRSLRTHIYNCEMCPAIAKGEECNLGANCPHSHNAFESWLHPQKYRTLLCKDAHKCDKYVCFFAHGVEQLRAPSNPRPAQASPAELSMNMAPSAGFEYVRASLGSSSPTYTASSSMSSSTADGSGIALSLGSSSSSSMHTVAVLMEQVQQARKMAQESWEAAAQAERQLQAVTAAVMNQSCGSGPGLGVKTGPQLLSALTAMHVSDSDSKFNPQQCNGGFADQPVVGHSPFGQFTVPTAPSAMPLAPQYSWIAEGSQATGNYLSRSGSGMVSAPSLTSGGSLGLYGSSPASAMSITGAYDLTDGAVDAAGTTESQPAPLCVFLPQKQLQQPPILLQSAASATCQIKALASTFCKAVRAPAPLRTIFEGGTSSASCG